MDVIEIDVAIVGAGGAGLRAAIAVAEADPSLTLALISKVYPMRSHTVAAFGGHGVAAHRIDLGDQRERERGVGFRHRDGCAQAGATSPNDSDVDFNHVHKALFPGAPLPALIL